MSDKFNLKRFVVAQELVIAGVRAELRRGHKVGHWMWFIFPQLKGLGLSSMAQEFGISSRAEAKAYLDHPVLGPRLVECTELVNAVESTDIEQILGDVDALKFRSCLTLFGEVAEENGVFVRGLEKFYDGVRDERTIRLLQERDRAAGAGV